MVSLPTVAILGAGSMGGAILGGLQSPGIEISGGIRVTNRTKTKADAITGEAVTSFSTETDPDANRKAVTGAGIVLLAVKPAMIPDLLVEIKDAIQPDAIVVSVAAGVTISKIESLVADSVAVFRAMPNTPSLIGLGVTGLSAGTRATEVQLNLVKALFETVGEVVVIPESQIDQLSTISGSGPAYVFYLIEELTRTAIDLGFDPETARLLVSETFRGASELLVSTGEQAEDLRKQVTSPKGTTERAIAVLQSANLKELFDQATAAALARAKELAAG